MKGTADSAVPFYFYPPTGYYDYVEEMVPLSLANRVV